MAGPDRRVMPRFYFVSRVDVLVAGGSEPVWAAVANISRSGVALYIRQPMQPRTKATLRFHFQGEGGREVTEDISATLVWKSGETAGLAFEAPLLDNTPAAAKAPQLTAHLAKKEAAGGK